MRRFIVGSFVAAAALLAAPAVAQAAAPAHGPAGSAPAQSGQHASFPDYYPSYTPGCSFTPHHTYVGEGVEAYCDSGPGLDYRVVARCENSRYEWLEFGRVVPVGGDSSIAQCRGSGIDPGRVMDYRIDFY